MKHRIVHRLPMDEAKEVLKRAWEHYSKKFSGFQPSIEWHAEDQATVAMTIKGKRLHAKVCIEAQDYLVDVDVPFLLRPLQGIAVKRIDEEVQKWIRQSA